ncbi:MAG: rhomboid family intramembrane serine protease [Candidatus Marinimicrobia bacterium]|nr:rhomboid family intramembrane serine protease [Candidatus Neomarinimicrobiota bacterium]
MNQYRFNMRRKLTPGIRVLIITNALIFLLGWIFPQLNKYMVIYGGLVPDLFTKHFFLWQPISYMFLHGGFMHLFFNMFALWMFGTELESQWGTKFFLKFYFISGIGAGILSAIIQPASQIPIIGASGAIYGLLLAFGLMYPNRIVYLNFLIPIKVKYFVMIFAAIELFSSIGGGGDGVAHLTHLSGMAFGYLFLLWNQTRKKHVKKEKIIFHWGSKTKDFTKKPPKKKTFNSNEQELQSLLTRINKDGYGSLSEEEKERLLKLTEKFDKN